MLSAKIIDNWESLEAMEGEWNELLRKSHANIIFLTWEWVKTWLSINRHSVQPLVVAVRNDTGDLVGLAPFYLATYRLLKVIPYRVLRIAGDYPTGAECLDWIVLKGMEAKVYHEIAATLKSAAGRWDCLWMPYVPSWTGASVSIKETCLQNNFYCHMRSVEFGSLALPENMDAFYKEMNSKRRHELRRQSRNVFKNSNVEIKRCMSDAELHSYLDALFELHHRRWQTRGEEGTFKRKPGEALFYSCFFPLALKKGWLRLYGLTNESGFKAIQIGYFYDNTFYGIQEGFDPDYVKGVGNVLRSKIIEECIGQGVECYDFLGEVSEHKKRWEVEERTGYHMFIGSRKSKNMILFANKIWPTGSYFRPTVLPAPDRLESEK